MSLSVAETVSSASVFFAGPPGVAGRSLMPIWKSEPVLPILPGGLISEFNDRLMLETERYKIVFNRSPLGDDRWQLFNIVEDPGESRDLAREMPQRFQRMLSAYERYARTNKVLPIPPGYDHNRQLVLNTLHIRAREPFLVLVFLLFILIPFVVAGRMKKAST